MEKKNKIKTFELLSNKIIETLDKKLVYDFYLIVLKENILDFIYNSDFNNYDMHQMLIQYLSKNNDNSMSSFIKYIDDNKEKFKLVK